MVSKNIYTNTLAEYESRKLLGREKLRRVASASFAEAFRILLEYGYYDDGSKDIDGFIEAQLRQLKNFVEENNAPPELAKVLFEDDAVDAAKDAAKLGKNFVKYCKSGIDITNILSAYRAKKMGWRHEKLLEELVEGGEIPLEAFNGILLRNLKGTEYEEAAFLLESGNLAGFRKHTEQLRRNILKDEMTDFMKRGPFLRFVIDKLAEIRAVNFVLVCIKNGIEFDLNDLGALADEL